MAQATFTPTAAEYTAGDVIGGAQEFPGVGPASGSNLLILGHSLLIAHTALVSSEGAYTLHLYNVTPPSAIADNTAWDLPAGDRSAYLGSVALGTPVDIGSSLFVQNVAIKQPLGFVSSGSIWGYLVNAGTMTPTAAARIVKLHTGPLS